MTRRKIALLVLLCSWASLAQAAVFDDVALSPRARAMGEASVASPADAWSFFHNPGVLPTLDRLAVSTSTVQPNDMEFNRLTAGGISYKLPQWNTGLALGFRSYAVDFKDKTLLDESVLTGAAGFTLFEDASSSAHVGVSANVYSLEFGQTVGGLDPGSANTVGIDVGAYVTLHERTRAGFFTRNINNPTIGEDSEELRRVIAFGMAYEPYDGVLTTFDIRNALDEEVRFHGGAEYAIDEVLALRLGLMTAPTKVTGGFGVTLPVPFSLEYAFSTGGGVLDGSHHFGLSFRFAGSEDE